MSEKRRRSSSRRSVHVFSRSPIANRSREFVRQIQAGIQGAWTLARLDVLLWRRMPWAIASALIPPLGMAIMLVVLSYTVTQEPVALVIQSRGAYTNQMTMIIESETDAYSLKVMNTQEAMRLLHDQEIAAIITIPAGFDQQVIAHTAHLQLTLNNVDIDFSDDIRRSVDRSVGQFDTSALNDSAEHSTNSAHSDSPNPYLISVDEQDLRKTTVDFLRYQVLPVLILLVLTTGLMSTALLCAQARDQGTARHLAVAPLPAWALIAGRLLGGFCISFAILIPALSIGILAGVVAPPTNHWPALVVLFVLTALGASAMGVVLGTLIHGTRNIVLATSIFATYLFFLGGGFTTIAFLPQWLQDVSSLNPIRYAIDGMRQALFYPDLSGFYIDILVLLGTVLVAVFLGTLAVRRS
ncbi:MAG TPA: ABC transporter permease [Ktedonobacteraceae bacterium]|nr:ABC transporter permease [Ktedonobacteraceae bacterium]